jgi:site-specific DNA-methyltransferase (adenine-specific)
VRPFYDHAGIQIFLGDCRHVLPNITAEVIVTDPPYGLLDRDGKIHMAGGVVGDAAWGAWDESASWDWVALCREVTAAVVFHDHKDAGRAVAALAAADLPLRQFLYWDKGDSGINPRRNFVNCVEQAVYARRGTTPWNGGGATPNIFRFNRGPTPFHPTQKPVEVMAWIIRAVTDRESVVLDPFMGSGSTLVAAKLLGRKAIGIEMSEDYCRIAVRRLQQEVLPLHVEPEPTQASFFLDAS